MALVGNTLATYQSVPILARTLKKQLYQLLKEDLGEFLYPNNIRIPGIFVEDQPPPRKNNSKLNATGGTICLLSPQYHILSTVPCLTDQTLHNFYWILTLLWYGDYEHIQEHFYLGAMCKIRSRFRNIQETIMEVEEGQPPQVVYRIHHFHLINNYYIN